MAPAICLAFESIQSLEKNQTFPSESRKEEHDFIHDAAINEQDVFYGAYGRRQMAIHQNARDNMKEVTLPCVIGDVRVDIIADVLDGYDKKEKLKIIEKLHRQFNHPSSGKLCKLQPALEEVTTSEMVADHLNAMYKARKAFIESESSEKLQRALRHQKDIVEKHKASDVDPAMREEDAHPRVYQAVVKRRMEKAASSERRTILEEFGNWRKQENYVQSMSPISFDIKRSNEDKLTKSEITEVRRHSDGFKIRAHSVLQKKAKSPEVDVSELKSEKDQLVADLDTRQALIQQLQSEISSLKAESGFMVAEKQTLEHQVSSLNQEMRHMEATYKDKLAAAEVKAQAKTTELQLMIANMASQNEAISKSFKSQLECLQNSHRREVESLQTKLEETEDKLWQIKNTVKTSPVSPGITPVSSNGFSKANIPISQAEQSTSAFASYHRRQPSHGGNDEPRIDITNMIREQGEGSEWVEPSRGSPAPRHGYSPPSLEQLISSPLPTNASTNSFDDNASIASFNTETTTKEVSRLEARFETPELKIKRFMYLLNTIDTD
ncbi:unnamed protein product, partial [Meganyctiphanes norvegica]